MGGECDKNLAVFLILQGLLGSTWTAFAVHLYRQFSKPYNGDPTADRGPMNRASRLCMYDPFVCVVILLFPLSIAWSIVGLSWEGDAEKCDDQLKSMTSTSTSFMFTYLGMGIVVGTISMCCECCRTQRHTTGLSTQQHQQQHSVLPFSYTTAPPGGSNLWMGGTLVGRLLYPQVMSAPQHQPPFVGGAPIHMNHPMPSAPPMPQAGNVPGYPMPPGGGQGYARGPHCI